MDENNNNENKQNNVLKDAAKDAAKSMAKDLLKPIKKWIIIGALCLFGLLLIVGLLHLVEMQVKNIFNNLINAFSFGSREDAEPISSDTNDCVIYINKNGYYKLKEDYSEKILQELETKKVNNKVMGFNLDNEEEKKVFRDMIDKYIKAEVATTFPKTGRDIFSELFQLDDVEGNITIKRASATTGTTQLLTYKKYSEFKRMVENNNNNALNCFSVNPDNFKLCIARKESETQYWNIDASGRQTLASTEGGGLSMDELDYRKYMENYAVPLNFLTTMHLVSQDVDFMNELVDLATGADKVEPLVLTYVDAQQQYTTIYNYTGRSEEVVQRIVSYEDEEFSYDPYSTKALLTEDEIRGLTVGSIYKSADINNDNAYMYYSDAATYEKQVTTTYSGKLYITKTDTWLKTSERTVTKKTPDETITNGPMQNTINLDPRYYTYEITNDIESLTPPIIKIMDTVENTYIIESETSTSTNKEFSVVDSGSEITVQAFIDLINKYPKVKNNFTTSPSNIFYLLQENENTQKLEKIMRYVLFELNDVDYGVRLEDLDFLLEDETFISADGGVVAGGSVEETIWFTLLANGYSKASAAGVLGNIWVESGVRTNNLEDIFEIGGQHSLGHTDKSYTDAVNNGTYTRQQFISDHTSPDCGAGYGLLQWTWGTRKAGLYDLAKGSGRGIDDVNVQVEFLLKELEGIRSDSVWRTTDDPYEAGEVFCKGFVNPGAPSANVAIRAQKSQEYYDKYKDRSTGEFQPGGGGTTYSGKYTSTRGRTFTILNQNTISGWGNKCNRAAAAIIASGYTTQDPNTLINTLNTKYAEAGDTIVPRNNFFNLYGLELVSEHGSMGVSQYSETLRNHLKSGGYAMIWLNTSSGYYGASGTKWTGQIHWLAIIDYKVENGQEKIVVADWRGAGWYNIGEFHHGISKIALIGER